MTENDGERKKSRESLYCRGEVRIVKSSLPLNLGNGFTCLPKHVRQHVRRVNPGFESAVASTTKLLGFIT